MLTCERVLAGCSTSEDASLLTFSENVFLTGAEHLRPDPDELFF